MKDSLLLPNTFRKIGLALLPISITLLIVVFGVEYTFPFLDYAPTGHKPDLFDFNNYNFSDELAMVLAFLSLFMIAFSKEKIEDEYLQKIRLQALQISVYVSYAVLIASVLLVYGLNFMFILYGNLFTILVIFIIVYQYKMRANNSLKGGVDEE